SPSHLGWYCAGVSRVACRKDTEDCHRPCGDRDMERHSVPELRHALHPLHHALPHAGRAPSGRASLLASSILTGGSIRGLAIAAGVATVFGALPPFAQGCQSSATDLSAGTSCAATASTGAASTAVGFAANATGT